MERVPIVSVLQPLLEELHKHPPPAGSVGQPREPGVRELLPDGREREGPRVEFTVPRGEGGDEGKRRREVGATA